MIQMYYTLTIFFLPEIHHQSHSYTLHMGFHADTVFWYPLTIQWYTEYNNKSNFQSKSVKQEVLRQKYKYVPEGTDCIYKCFRIELGSGLNIPKVIAPFQFLQSLVMPGGEYFVPWWNWTLIIECPSINTLQALLNIPVFLESWRKTLKMSSISFSCIFARAASWSSSLVRTRWSSISIPKPKRALNVGQRTARVTNNLMTISLFLN